MNLQSVASAFPSNAYTQQECLVAMRDAEFWGELNSRSRVILEKVLKGDSGITKRHFCLDSLVDAWSKDAEQLNNAYEIHAPKLAAEAMAKAIKKSGHAADDIDALFISSCTGFLCPGVSSYVAEILGLREDVFLQDMTGLGCGAAIPLMRAAAGVVAVNPDAVVVTVAVEVCSAAFYVEDDLGVLISTCLFGDGAAAAVWSGEQKGWRASHFQSIHLPVDREKIRLTNAAGKLRNQLARSVPALVGDSAKLLYSRRCKENGEPQALITHGGGRDVLERLEDEFTAYSVDSFRFARSVMRDYGNMSSPSVFVALERFLEDEASTGVDHIWLAAFGAGFSAHSCELLKHQD